MEAVAETAAAKKEAKSSGGARNAAVKKFLAANQNRLLIGNKWIPAKSGKTFEAVNPANEQVLAKCAEGDKADVDEAVKAARKAFSQGAWANTSPHDRSRLLRKWADLIEKHADELAELESLNNGMAITLAKQFVATAVESVHHFAGFASKIYGETVPSEPGMFNFTLRDPVGVCGAITPWNAPIVMATWKIAPALACGNTVILKPAEQTPLTALFLADLLLEAGLPEGVVNVITGFGPGAGSSISEHPGIDKVAFTGSTEVGKKILAASVGNLKRVTLELGGKSPNVVFPDANMETAVPYSMAAFSMLSGQVCVAGTRLFVQRECKDQFVDNLVKFTSTIKVGDPLDPETTMGPLASKEQYDRVKGYLEIGKKEGAKPTVGGSMMDREGYFVQPTIFEGVKNDMQIAREEIFGPVVSIIPFKDEDDAVLQGNDTTYGLGAAVWTRDVSRAFRVARSLKAGTVWVNNYYAFDPSMPFGGYKQSGLGRECGAHWYEHYTETKAVFVKL